MSEPLRPGPEGPTTHYELFAGLLGARVDFLVTGAAALVLHGVPRLTGDVDLLVDPEPGNLARLERLLAAWGYGEVPVAPGDAAQAHTRRFRHPQAALGEVDLVLPSPAELLRLRTGAAVASLVDIAIPLVGAADLEAFKEAGGSAADRDDAAALRLLTAIREGTGEQPPAGVAVGGEDATRREQIVKFSRWSVAARLDWLLAAARLARGLSPEAKPMTRGLVRRRPWTQRRG